MCAVAQISEAIHIQITHSNNIIDNLVRASDWRHPSSWWHC